MYENGFAVKMVIQSFVKVFLTANFSYNNDKK